MKNFKFPTKIILIVATALFVIGFVGLLISGHVVTGRSGFEATSTIPIDDVTGLDITTRNFRINLERSADSDIHVVFRAATEGMYLETNVGEDGILFVNAGIPQRNNRQIINFGYFTEHLTVYLPDVKFDSITASTTNARITADYGLEVGVLNLTTTNGRITIK